jgi:hypothetical protein
LAVAAAVSEALFAAILLKHINYLLILLNGVPEQAEIIPFEPDTGNAGAGRA